MWAQCFCSHVDVCVAESRQFRTARPGNVAAWLFTTLAFVVATRGPSYRIRTDFPGSRTGLLDDNWIQAVSYVAYGLVAVLTISAWPRWWASVRRLSIAHLAFGGVLLLSTAWSIDSWRSAEQSLIILTAVLGMLGAGAMLSPTALLTSIWTAMQSTLIWSLWARWHDWPNSLDNRGYLTGVFFNRNLLGAATAVAGLTSVALLWIWCRRPLALVPLGGLALAIAVGYRTDSVTPLIAVGLSVITGAFAVLWIRASAERQRQLRYLPALSAVAALNAFLFRDTVTSWFGRSPSMTGRTGVWYDIVDAWSRRPVQGFGFMAAWFDEGLRAALRARGRNLWEAHNGYLEVLLGAGLVAVIALAFVIWCVIRALRRSIAARTPYAPWFVAAVMYVAVVNLGETNIGANRVPWMILVAVSVQAELSVRHSDDR